VKTLRESLPSVAEVRQRIAAVTKEEIRLCLMTAYLYAGRISEVVGHASPRDTTTARGPKGSDVRFDVVDGHEITLFTVYTAKRQGLERIVALPTEFEPWSKQIADYFMVAKDSFVFPFTRQYISKYILENETFKGYQYPIDRYRVKQGELVNVVPRHWNPFRLHALRHLRTTELVRFYHFRAEDLAAYCGWRLRTVAKDISPVMERYIDLSWQEYFPKLLKERGSNV
jgi:hypothetical protein